MYKIVRIYFTGGRRTVKSGLTLEEAKEHCSDPETSSNTCTLARNRRHTQERGPWFDGYLATWKPNSFPVTYQRKE
jgi:hypothetical protein